MKLTKVLVFVEKWGLFALLAITLASFVMAVREALTPGSPAGGTSFLGAILNIVTSDPSSATGWIKSTHGLVTITVGWAAIRVYMKTVGLKWDTFYARRLVRDHIIIVAGHSAQDKSNTRQQRSGTNAADMEVDKSALAIDLALSLAGAHTVVLSLPNVDDGNRHKLWKAGITVTAEDLGLPEVLQAVGTKRARMLISMRDNFRDNVSLTRSALSPALDNPTLECKCMLEPLSVKRSFQLDDYFETASLPFIRIFNEAELIARRLVRDFPPDLPVATSGPGVHVLLIGLGSEGQSILLQLARIGHYRSGKKPKVTVVDWNVKQLWKQVREAHPALDDWLIVETEEKRIEDIEATDLNRWSMDERPVTMVYVCTKDEIANLRIARIYLRSTQERAGAGQVVVHRTRVVALDPPGGGVLSEFASHEAQLDWFHLFSLVRAGSETGDSESILSEVDDARAKLFHEDYCRKNDAECARDPSQQKAPNNLPWECLTEDMRDSNRIVTDHFGVKLRSVGLHVVPKGDAQPALLTPEELEILAEMEHNRWWANKALAGWRPGARDNKLKTHPDMIPYNELTDPIKQYDRNSVSKMLEILGNEGLDVTRDVPC